MLGLKKNQYLKVGWFWHRLARPKCVLRPLQGPPRRVKVIKVVSGLIPLIGLGGKSQMFSNIEFSTKTPICKFPYIHRWSITFFDPESIKNKEIWLYKKCKRCGIVLIEKKNENN